LKIANNIDFGVIQLFLIDQHVDQIISQLLVWRVEAYLVDFLVEIKVLKTSPRFKHKFRLPRSQQNYNKPCDSEEFQRLSSLCQPAAATRTSGRFL
jgi:hypothetical protein